MILTYNTVICFIFVLNFLSKSFGMTKINYTKIVYTAVVSIQMGLVKTKFLLKSEIKQITVIIACTCKL